MQLVKTLTAFNNDQLLYNTSSGMGNVKCENLFKHIKAM